MAGIDRLGGAIYDRWGKLDIMVGNAGMLGSISPIGHVEAKVFDKLMALNVTSIWRLIRFRTHCCGNHAGRALLLSPSVAHSARAYWGPYAASKGGRRDVTGPGRREPPNAAEGQFR